MSLERSSINTGQFATSRGGPCAEDLNFVRECMKRRVPAAHIANMINRPLVDVQGLIDGLKAVARAQAAEAGDTAPPEDANIVLSLYRGLITRKPTARAIIEEVAEEYSLTVEAIVGQGRSRHVAQPRQALMHRLYSTGRYSSTQIGQMLGGRDHTTVLHGLRAYEQRCAEAAVKLGIGAE